LILKKVVTLAFVLFLMPMFFSNAVAHDIVHIAEYDLMGRVDLIQVTGSNHGSGAQRKLSISGDGKVEKVSNIVQQRGRLKVDDSQSWVTAVDALNNLKVISATELSAPPQLVFTTTMYVPLNDDDGGSDEATLPAEKAALGAELLIAETYLDSVTVSTNGKEVPRDELWVPGSVWGAYSLAVEEAQIIYGDLCADQTGVDQAVADGEETWFESCFPLPRVEPFCGINHG